MTDEQILKSLECCSTGESICFMCPLYNKTAHCVDDLAKGTLDLINRQKAEIKGLHKENKILSVNADTAFQDGLNENRDLFKKEVEAEIKAETIKEFAKKLCENRVANDPVVIAANVELKQMTEVLNEDL